MKVLSLTQPWATLVILGAKKFETRSRPFSYRGPIAIHASKTFPRWAKDLCHTEPFCTVLRGHGYSLFEDFPLGKILGVVDVVECRGTSGWVGAPWPGTRMIRMKEMAWIRGLSEQERAFGDYSENRYAFALDNPRALTEPIEARGMLGLWNFDHPALEALLDAHHGGVK